MASSSASWNCQWTRMVTCLPVLCGIGAPCQCWGDRVGVGYNHFWCLDICGVLIFVGVLISQYFWELMSEQCWVPTSLLESLLMLIGGCFRQMDYRGGLVAPRDDGHPRTKWNRILPRLLCWWSLPSLDVYLIFNMKQNVYFPTYCAGDIIFSFPSLVHI